MHVHDVQIGELRAQQIQVAQVRRGLEHPALGVPVPLRQPLAFLPLQELQHAVQVVVGGAEVLLVQPGSVVGQVCPRLGDVG